MGTIITFYTLVSLWSLLYIVPFSCTTLLFLSVYLHRVSGGMITRAAVWEYTHTNLRVSTCPKCGKEHTHAIDHKLDRCSECSYHDRMGFFRRIKSVSGMSILGYSAPFVGRHYEIIMMIAFTALVVLGMVHLIAYTIHDVNLYFVVVNALQRISPALSGIVLTGLVLVGVHLGLTFMFKGAKKVQDLAAKVDRLDKES